MNPSLQSGIILLIATILILSASYKKDAGEHKRHKVIHSIFVIYLVGFHSIAFHMVGWVVGHSSEIMEYCYVQKGLFNPASSLVIWILNTVLSVVAVLLGFTLARRKKASLRWLFKFIPVIAIVDWLEVFKASMDDPMSIKAYVILGAVFILILWIPYILMLMFYSRQSVQLSIFGIEKENNSNQSIEAIVTTPVD